MTDGGSQQGFGMRDPSIGRPVQLCAETPVKEWLQQS
jgi:hypothetical protein